MRHNTDTGYNAAPSPHPNTAPESVADSGYPPTSPGRCVSPPPTPKPCTFRARQSPHPRRSAPSASPVDRTGTTPSHQTLPASACAATPGPCRCHTGTHRPAGATTRQHGWTPPAPPAQRSRARTHSEWCGLCLPGPGTRMPACRLPTHTR
ncbi:hypothetical protein D3C81_1587620 [compost metagenome]